MGGREAVPQWANAGTVVAPPRARVDLPPLSSLSLSGIATVLGAYLAAEADRWFAWHAAAFGAGIVAYFGLRTEPSLELAACVVGATLITGVLGLRAQHIALRFLCALVAASGLGFGAAKFRTEFVAAPTIARETGPVDIEGRIESVELRGPNRARIVLAPTKIEGIDAVPARVRLTLMGAKAVAAVEPGATVTALAVLRPPPEPAMPRGYDFARWAYFQGIGGVGFTYGAPKRLEAAAPSNWASRFHASVARLRLAMTARVEKAVPGPDGTIAAALITGTRAAIPEDDTEAYRDSGLAHVLSISGLHLALAGLGVFWAVRALLALSPALALTQPIKKWAALAALGAASFYLLISGAASPAIRSYLMLACMLVSVLADRPALSMRAVAMAALAILIFHPEDIVNPGFQMSFAAVIGLIALAEWVTSRPRSDEVRRGRAARLWRGCWRTLTMVLATSLVAALATTPFAIYHFDRAASYSLLANLLAEPIVAFLIMPAAAIAVIAMPFGWEYGPLQAMGWGVHQMTAIAHWVAGLPGAANMVRAWPSAALIAIVFGGLWFALWRLNWRWLGTAAVAVGFAVISVSVPPDIFIARDGTAAAVRGGDGRLTILGERPDNYTAEQWLLRDGDPRDVAAARAAARCDSLGCFALAAGERRIALSLRAGALVEDCARADVLISAVPVRRACQGPDLVLDRFDIAKNGATALTFTTSGVKIETVAAERGERPWSSKR